MRDVQKSIGARRMDFFFFENTIFLFIYFLFLNNKVYYRYD